MRGQAPARKRTTTVPYQIALRTSRPAEEVLAQVDVDQVPGLAVAERGAHYLVVRPKRRFRYGADIAAGLGVAIVLALLILTAVTPVVLVALPVAFLPAIPLLLEHRPDLAVSAIEDDGETRVTAHGQASPELVEYLDRYLEALPAVDGSGPEDGDPEEGVASADAPYDEDDLSAGDPDGDGGYGYEEYEEMTPAASAATPADGARAAGRAIRAPAAAPPSPTVGSARGRLRTVRNCAMARVAGRAIDQQGRADAGNRRGGGLSEPPG